MNLFDGNDQSLDLDDNVDFLSEITKPGAKFDRSKYESEADLLTALAKKAILSDRHINTLEAENNEFRETNKRIIDESKAGQRLQVFLDKLENTPNPLTDDNTNKSLEESPKLDPNQIESLISSKLQQHEQTKRETDNFNMVQNKVKEVFGSDFKALLKQKADALGLNVNDVNLLARSNPNLFFKTFDVVPQTTQNFQAPPRSGVRSDNFAPRGSDKRTMSYYNKIMRDNPKLLQDSKIRIQMDKDAQALGIDFFDA